MRRRAFIGGLGTAVLFPRAVFAQQSAMPVVGLLGSASADLFAGRVRAFLKGLRETGYVEGRNVAIEYRWANGLNDRLPGLAADLVHRRVTVIAAISGTPAAMAAKMATATTPIVFYLGGDPVEEGLVASLSRPGANVTGFTALSVEVGSKRLEMLHQVVSSATNIALLVNPTNPRSETLSKDLRVGADALGLHLHVVQASTERGLNSAFESLGRLGVEGLVIGIDPFFNARSEKLAQLALHHRIPTIFQYRDFVAAGAS
jgi:ABC-type uncharacterized transport system substrate-binding protein